jgi:hypothetical protein
MHGAVVSVGDGGLQAASGTGNGVRAPHADGVEALRPGEALDQAAQGVGLQKSSFS